MAVCQQNLNLTQILQKRAHYKEVMPQSYTPGKKVWLNSKYLQIKQNRKLKTKFLDLFQVLYLVSKQVYKFELLKKWKIHNVFYILLLE